MMSMTRFRAISLSLTCFLGLSATLAVAATELPAAGADAPAFELNSQDGKPTKLSDFQGKWVVLYFYPKDFTSGCTLQAQKFQQDLAKYETLNASILGISVDDSKSHKGFCEKEGLNFTLLSDTDAKVSEAYGSVLEFAGVKVSARNTFLIGPDGKIAKVFPKVKPAGHSEEVLAAITELQKK